MDRENLDALLDKQISIRSLQHPHFELINGILRTTDLIYSYEVRDTGKSFRFDSDIIKERINNTLFI